MHWTTKEKTSTSYDTTKFARDVTRAWQRQKIAAEVMDVCGRANRIGMSGKNLPTAFVNIFSKIAQIYSEDRENQPGL